MTMRYTQNEWVEIIDRAEQALSNTPQVYKAPSVGDAAFAQTIDHTLLKPEATAEQIDTLCEEAVKHNFKRAIHNLQGSSVVVACVIGFHEGTQSTSEKTTEAAQAIAAGARELDLVLNWPLLKQKHYSNVYTDIAAVRNTAPQPIILKVILETSQLSRYEIVAGCKITEAAKSDFVKTSTGFNGQGATAENVALMKGVVGDGMGVKASGGVRTVDECIVVMEAGAQRIGSSNGVWIMDEAQALQENVTHR